jgi:hypothetical protein
MDAAVARLIRKADVVAGLPVIDAVHSGVMDPVVYQSVRKFGAATGHTLGIVADVSADVQVQPVGEDPILYSRMTQVLGCEWPFSAGGDSGSLVVDALRSEPVGILFGGQGFRTFVAPLGRILKRFHARIAG